MFSSIQFKRILFAGTLALFIALGGHYFEFGEFLKGIAEEVPGIKLLQHIPQPLHEIFFERHPYILTGLAIFTFMALSFQHRTIRNVADWTILSIAPEAPPFLDAILEFDSDDKLDPRAKDEPFLGREEEMRLLMRFAGGKQLFSWLSVYGPMGIGKKRLALEWLKRLQAIRDPRWDVGVAIPNSEIEGWKLRRPTAVVVLADDVDGSLWPSLMTLGRIAERSRCKMRVLVIDTSQHSTPLPPFDNEFADFILRHRFGGHDGSAPASLELSPLSDEHWYALRNSSVGRQDDEMLSTNGRGLPLYAKLGANPWTELEERAAILINKSHELFAAHGPRLLALSSLIGPFDSRLRRAVAPEAGNLDKLASLFAGSRPNDLRDHIPTIQPRRLGQVVMLQALGSLQDADVQHVVHLAFTHNSQKAGLRIGELWDDRPEALTASALYSGHDMHLTAFAEQCHLNAEQLRRSAHALLTLDFARTRLCEKAWCEDLEESLGRLRALSAFPVPPLGQELTIEDLVFFEHEVTTPDKLPFNYQAQLISEYDSAGSVIFELWPEFELRTRGWLGCWPMARLRIEAAAVFFANAGLVPMQAAQRVLDNVLPTMLAYRERPEVADLSRRVTLAQALFMSKLGEPTDIQNEIKNVQNPWLHDSANGEYVTWRIMMLHHLTTGLVRIGKLDEARSAAQQAAALALTQGPGNQLNWFFVSQAYCDLLGPNGSEAAIDLAQEAVRSVFPVWSAFRGTRGFDEIMSTLLSRVAVCYGRHGEEAECDSLLRSMVAIAAATPTWVTLTSAASGLATLVRFALSKMKREDFIRQIDALPKCDDSRIAIRVKFWAMIAQFHALQAEVQHGEIETISARLERIRSIWLEYSDEPKFRYWFVRSLVAATQAFLEGGEISIGQGLLDETQKLAVESRSDFLAEQCAIVANLLIAVSAKHANGDGQIAGMRVIRELSLAHPGSMEIQRLAMFYSAIGAQAGVQRKSS